MGVIDLFDGSNEAKTPRLEPTRVASSTFHDEGVGNGEDDRVGVHARSVLADPFLTRAATGRERRLICEGEGFGGGVGAERGVHTP